MNKNILFVIFLIQAISCLHLEKQNHQRTISYECCQSKGGFQCGKIVKQCCQLPPGISQKEATSEHCIKGGFLGTSQFCPGKSIVQQCTYCHQQCQSKGGKICGWGTSGNPQCCKQQDCIPNIDQALNMQICKPNTTIALSKCVKDLTTIDSAINSITSLF